MRLQTRTAVYLGLLFVGFIIAVLLDEFGLIDSIVSNDTTIFNNLITTTFTLAGLSVAAIAFSIKSNPDEVRGFIPPTCFFLVGGMFFYAAINMGELYHYVPNFTVNSTLTSIFGFYEVIASLGVVLYFLGIISLVAELVSLYQKLGTTGQA